MSDLPEELDFTKQGPAKTKPSAPTQIYVEPEGVQPQWKIYGEIIALVLLLAATAVLAYFGLKSDQVPLMQDNTKTYDGRDWPKNVPSIPAPPKN